MRKFSQLMLPLKCLPVWPRCPSSGGFYPVTCIFAIFPAHPHCTGSRPRPSGTRSFDHGVVLISKKSSGLRPPSVPYLISSHKAKPPPTLPEQRAFGNHITVCGALTLKYRRAEGKVQTLIIDLIRLYFCLISDCLDISE